MVQRKQISIWFFIGLLLAAYGALILGAGVVEIWRPPQPPVVLARLHFGLWWGAVLLAAGVAWAAGFRPRARPSARGRRASSG